MTDSKIESAKKLLASGVPARDVAKNLGVSVPTLYRWVTASAQAWRTIFPLSEATPFGYFSATDHVAHGEYLNSSSASLDHF